MALKLVLLALCLAAAVAKQPETIMEMTYNGWKVIRANIVTQSQLLAIESMGLDVWSHDSQLIMGQNDIRVTSKHAELLASLDVNFEYLINDLEAVMNEERASLMNRSMAPTWFTAYHTYDEIVAFLANLSSAYPTLIKYNPNIGKTVQGRNIPAVVITGASGNNKKKVFWSAQQHAREWIASHTALYLIDTLLAGYATDTTIKAILDGTIIHIIPLVNPDGYVYSWSTNRLWRKNRKLNSGGSYGVDLNRNWNDHWGGEGSSHTQTSDTYCGTKAFSEPESTAVSAYVSANGPFNAAIDWHSYSQLILRPYGWTNKAPSNEATAKLVGDGIAKAILSSHNVAYTSEGSWELYYTTGSAQDWYFAEEKVPLSYTIELRDTGAYGFVLPANQIIPTGEENLAGMKYFLNYVLQH